MALFLTDLKLRPVHGHVDPVGVGPEPEVLLVVGVVDRVVELLVDLRQPEKYLRFFNKNINLQVAILNNKTLIQIFISGRQPEEDRKVFFESLQKKSIRNV